MRVSYQHANVHSGNESALLRFTTENGTRACILVDAGDDVDIKSMLADEEYLNAILLTHAHIDHYRTLAKNVHHSAPIYASPATATVLEQALPEAEKDNDLGDVSIALEAIEPIDEWTPILSTLEVRPIAAGHTPGAAGFILRFRDENSSDDPFNSKQHILVSGDFTARPCAGFPGLRTSYPFDDQQTEDRELLENLNTASYEVNPGQQLQEAVPNFARITAAEFEQIDVGDLKPPKPGIRTRSALSRLLQQNQPLQDYDPESDQIEHYAELAEIVANGGVKR